jgi:hypothetical protein
MVALFTISVKWNKFSGKTDLLRNSLMTPTTKDDFYLSSRKLPRYLFLLSPSINRLVAIERQSKSLL